MKHAALLSKLGPSYPVYPDLIKNLKSSSAGILLSYLIHLTETLAPKDGWIKHSSVEFNEGSGLSYEAQLASRKKLKAQGLIEEKHLRLEHDMYFRVNLDALRGVAK
jgi:hypothetical protein